MAEPGMESGFEGRPHHPADAQNSNTKSNWTTLDRDDAESFCTAITQVYTKSSYKDIIEITHSTIDTANDTARRGSTEMHHEIDLLPSRGATTSNQNNSQQVKAKSAASILAAYRRSIRKGDSEQPNIPKRTTSKTRPPKRKRHEDYVAFHRNSCQLFSSLDGTLEQIRMSSSSSESSFSLSSGSCSTRTSPSLEISTRATSFDYDNSSPLLRPQTAQYVNGVKTKALPKRPELLRRSRIEKPATSSSPALNDIRSNTPILENSTTPALEAKLTPFGPCSLTTPAIPATTSSHSPHVTSYPAYSSQATLPLPLDPQLQPQPVRNPTSITSIHWNSPETRRREQARVEAANSGFRLFLKKVFPQNICRKVGGGRVGFWDGNNNENDDDDARSVRRFRISVDDMNEKYPTAASNEIMTTEYRSQTWDEKTIPSRTTTELSSTSVDSNTVMWHAQKSGKEEQSLLRKIFGCHL